MIPFAHFLPILENLHIHSIRSCGKDNVEKGGAAADVQTSTPVSQNGPPALKTPIYEAATAFNYRHHGDFGIAAPGEFLFNFLILFFQFYHASLRFQNVSFLSPRRAKKSSSQRSRW